MKDEINNHTQNTDFTTNSIESTKWIDNKGRNQPFLPVHKRSLRFIDKIQEKNAKITMLEPDLLLTKNRMDINYRIEFLHDVFSNNIEPENTLYFQFLSDKDNPSLVLSNTILSENFQKLFVNIKKNGQVNPIFVAKYDSDSINTRYILDGKKHWKQYRNATGFQIIDGAHRLAVCHFLKYKVIPVKIIKPLSFEIPNYTDYIAVKENQYRNNLK